KRLGGLVISWIHTGNWNVLETNLSHLKRALIWRVTRRDLLNPFRFWIQEWGRIWRRCRYPTGLFVVLLGPDGAGKSTVIRHLRENLREAFRQSEVFHLRPRVIIQQGTCNTVTDPHGKPPHPLSLSLVKIAYYLFDYGLGYLLKVGPKLVRTTLVLFDRYYDDLLIDPRRYRYGGPQWPVYFARRLVPRPDLFLILDVPANELLGRKCEVSLEELKRQREAYGKLAAEVPNAVLLDASLPPEEVSRKASEAVLDYLHERYLKRRHIWFRDDGSDTLNWLASILSSPEKMRLALSKPAHDSLETHWQAKGSLGWLALKDGRGYLIPLDSRQGAVNGLQPYNSQNLKARVTKKLLALGLKGGFAQPLLRNVQLLIRQDVPEEERSKISLLDHLKAVLGRRDLTVAISLGTPGPHRKPVIQVLTHGGEVLAYVKVGWNEATNALAEREAEVLQRFASTSFNSFTVPRMLHSGWWNGRFLCIHSPPSGKVQAAPQDMTPQYLNVLEELASLHTRSVPLKNSAFWINLVKRLEKVPSAYYRYVLREGANKVEECLGHTELPFHFRHG
ncbi:hypothetical protein GTO10_03900, partial [Candidatus Saccharibacteria bacterium]|nr:hypothetical protein [Candidatus Saccharibacteria bacterium]